MTNAKVMVCVTKQKTCERLIMNGYNLSKTENGKLYIVHVVYEKGKILDQNDSGEALEYLFNVSKKAGADLTVLRSKDILQTMVDFARENDITHIVMGIPTEGKEKQNINFGAKLKNALPHVELIEI